MSKFLVEMKALYSDFTFDCIQYLSSIHLFEDDISGENICKICFWLCEYANGRKPGRKIGEVTILLKGVESTTIRQSGALPLFIAGFFFDDLNETGFESIHYSIGDYESDSFEVKCADFEIISVQMNK